MALPPIIGRPPHSAATPSTAPQAKTGGAGDARQAAQRAFFQAALAKTGAPAPQAPTRAIQPPAARAAADPAAAGRAVQPTVTRLKDETTEPPAPGRILRPGSLVDIKV